MDSYASLKTLSELQIQPKSRLGVDPTRLMLKALLLQPRTSSGHRHACVSIHIPS